MKTEPAGRNPWIPYAVPMAAFLAFNSAEGFLPEAGAGASPLWYPAVYALKVAVVSAVAWHYRSAWRDFRARLRRWDHLLSLGTGLLVAALWIGLDGRYPFLPLQGSRTAFDPSVLEGPVRGLFLAVRFFGLVVLVPVIEELFWRSFLLRWITNPDFRKIPLGHVTLAAAAITSALFALAHPEWLPALITGLLWAWLLRHTRSLASCLISHVVANLALGCYVLVTGSWRFW